MPHIHRHIKHSYPETRTTNIQTFIINTNSFLKIDAPELDMFMAHDDDDGNDEFENNFDRRELLVIFEEVESPSAENEVVKSVKQLKSNKSP